MHRDIKRFSMDGEIADDSAIPRLRDEYERLIISEMREDGYIRLLDHGPIFSTHYNEETNTYTFVITVFGTYVGKRQSLELEGMTGTGRTPKRILPNKSKQSLPESA